MRQKRVKVLRLFLKRGVYRHAEKITVGELVVSAQPLIVAQTVFLRVLNNRQPVLRADQIRELTDSPVTANEIVELACAVQRRRVPVDMIVNMCFTQKTFPVCDPTDGFHTSILSFP